MKTDFFQNRKILIMCFICIFMAVLVLKLFHMQIINKEYQVSAKNNAIKERIVYPSRGDIFDCNGNLIACSEVVYDIHITPNYFNPKSKLYDPTFDKEEFCKLVGIDMDFFEERLEKCAAYSKYKPSLLISQLSKKDILAVQESLYKFRAIDIVTRTVRKYPYHNAAIMLGYVSEVSADFLSKNPDYSMGDYHGTQGLERIYEEHLRGKKGKRYVVVDAHNVELGQYNNGENDIAAEQGSNLILEIDSELQSYGEYLMQGKRGSIVAIDPQTGGILAMVSAPCYDPNLLVGRDRSQNYKMLQGDTANRPLLNRAVAGEYPPGSTFKVFNALVTLQENAINQHTRFSCQGKDSQPMQCTHAHESPLNVVAAIRESCNPYFRLAFEKYISQYDRPAEGLEIWHGYAEQFGFGQAFKTDVYGQRKGLVPNSAYYDRIYGKNRWRATTIRSLAIGQGEILVTPFQLANYAAIIGNEGHYITPHIVKYIVNTAEGDTIVPYDKTVFETEIDKEHFKIAKNGMREMITKTNSKVFGDIKNVEFCGKTGTVQNAGADHAMFIGFAPKDNPEIAIAVVVENSGFGSTYALPIASLMVESYLTDSIAKRRKWVEKRVLETVTLNQQTDNQTE